MTRVTFSSLVLSAVVLLGAAAAVAQEHPNEARGFKPDQVFQLGNLDNVNHFNGNLIVTLPVGTTYPVSEKLSYGLSLAYNGNVWELSPYTGPEPGNYYVMEPMTAISNAGLGWLLSLGQLEFVGSPFPGQISRFVYRSPDGAEHGFASKLHANETPTNWIFYTVDNTYLRLNETTMELEFPDGTVHAFLPGGMLKQIRDRFGNAVNVTYPNGNWQFADTHGRVQTIVFQNATQPTRVIDYVTLTAFGVQTAVFDFVYEDKVVRRACGSQVPDPSQLAPTETVTMLTKISLPDGSSYVPSYSTGNPSLPCDDVSGQMIGLTLPTLGQIAWSYGKYSFPDESSDKARRRYSYGVVQRQLKGASGQDLGTWTYAPQLLPTPASSSNPVRERVTTVTAPFGHKTVHYFSAFVSGGAGFDNSAGWSYGDYGLPFSKDKPDLTSSPLRYLSIETKNGAGTVVRGSYVRYERDAQDISHDSNRRLASSRVVFHDDGGVKADETLSDFDGHGHYRDRTISGTFPGSPLRTTRLNYNPERGTYGQGNYMPFPTSSPWFLERFVSSKTTEGSQVLFSSFCFDANTAFLQGRRVHAANGEGLQTNDLVEVFTHQGGNVNSQKSFGGDTQAVSADPVQGAICSMVLQPRSPTGATLTPVYQYSHGNTAGVRSLTTVSAGGTTLKLLDLSIETRTGLPSASRDAAGIEEQYAYDTLGRLTTVTPVGDPAVIGEPTDALTTHTYCSATSNPGCGARAEVVVARKMSVAGAEITALRYRFDDLGRLISEEERMPPSGTYQARTITYNLMGWRLFVSEKGAAAGTYFNYNDPFGRVTLIRPPDGAVHDVTLSYLGARQVQRTVKVSLTAGAQETPATTTEVYDHFGRLYEVTEPNGIKTRYDYDAGNRLKKVCQNATGAGTATCGQARFFTSDNRGFLLSEQHPEKGVNGNGVVSYFSYDARGHALRRIDGPHDLTFSYDGAERLTLVRETGGLQRSLKSFGYGTGTAAPDYSKGKVKTAKRFNYVGSPFNATVEVRDTYVYGGRGGRVSQTDTQMFYNGASSEGFRQSATWDNLGNLASRSYPDCITGSCTSLDVPRTVSFTYSYGRLATVPGFTGTATTTAGAIVSQITYHPNGTVFQVPHANQMLYTVGRDTWGMARPAWFQANRGATIYWNTGTHTYDGSGNLEGTGELNARYDTLSRVLQMSTMLSNSQSYTYDVYGNVQSVMTNSSTVGTPTSSATNHLSAGAYDGAGSLSSWAGNTYEHDAFGQLKRYVAGAEDWRYVYTADDERFWSYRVGGGGSLWSLRGLDGQVLRRYEAHVSWGTYEDYVYRDGQLLAAALTPVAPAPRTGMWHFHLDHLGTPRMITNQNGASIGFHRYYPFGQEETALQEGEIRKFTGHERDLASLAGTADDLDYMHARHHSPLLGRLLSFDPVGGNERTPQSWNRYAYVMDRPLVYTDPRGLVPVGIAYSFGLAWYHAYTFSDTITVTTTALNPLTLQNLSLSGWSLFGAIGAALSTGGPEGPARSQAAASPCGSVSFGISVDVSTINPLTSGGGGTYGLDLQYVPGEGLGLYTFSTPSNSTSVGYDLGIAATGNIAIGSGQWSGVFGNVMGSYRNATFGGFFTPPNQFPGLDEPGVGWYGLQGGSTAGAPVGVGVTVTNYTKRLHLGFSSPCR